MWQDLRYSIRTLLKNPGFAAVGLLVLALAIAVNTAIFSIVNAVLFRPLPVRAPSELMFMYYADPRILGLTYRDFLHLKENKDAFVDLLARCGWSGRVSAGGETEQTSGEVVSSNYFDLLGVKPVLGRTFSPDDDRASTPQPVAIISHALWKARFNSDPGVLGKIIEVDRQPFAIVGVMGPEFKGVSNPWQPSQYWIPIVPWVAGNETAKTYNLTLDRMPVYAIGRLKAGVTAAQAPAVIATKSKQLQQAFRPSNPNWSLILLESRKITLPFDPLQKVVPSRLAAALMAVTGIVLLIATANLAGILMARGITRRGEIAIRLAFGAGRWRLMRQLLTESIFLAMLGGALGLLFARLLVHLFLTNTPDQFGLRQVSLDVPLDMHVLLFTALACIGAGLLVGLAPALQASKIDLLSSLGGGGAIVPRQPRTRLRYWIVVPQVCLSLVLLLVAGVFVRILLKAELLDVGYDPEHVVFVDFGLPVPSILRQQPKDPGGHEKYEAAAKAFTERRTLLNRRLLETEKGLPNFAAAGLTDSLPLSPMHTYILSRDDVSKGNQPRWVSQATVSPGYFQALGIPLLRGRYFDDRDTIPGPRRDVIVCEVLARQLWPDENPIGQHLAFTWPGRPPCRPRGPDGCTERIVSLRFQKRKLTCRILSRTCAGSGRFAASAAQVCRPAGPRRRGCLPSAVPITPAQVVPRADRLELRGCRPAHSGPPVPTSP
jgi:predicted permease